MSKPQNISSNPKPHSAVKLTPMMAQYMDIKQEAGDEVILFYRMGDFYEMFFEDARKAAKALDIALTKRGKHEGSDIPMCGVPVHSSETYLQKLIKKGFRVAVCEQTESPADAKKRGYKAVVKREIVRVVTPGTLTEDTLLDARRSNIILAIAKSRAGQYAISWADISEGQFHVSLYEPSQLDAEISALAPKEILVSENLLRDENLTGVFQEAEGALTPVAQAKFDHRAAERQLKAHFQTKTLNGFGDYTPIEISAAGALLDYLILTQAGQPLALPAPTQRDSGLYMAIDPATRKSLEIDKTQTGATKGSLLSVIDRTVSGPGARLLASWLNRPLLDEARINARLDGISFFEHHPDLNEPIRQHLKTSADAARSFSRLALGRGGPRDICAIATTALLGEQISAIFATPKFKPLPKRLERALSGISLATKPELAALIKDIKNAFQESPPLYARDGGFIKQGWSANLDALMKLRDDSRKYIAALQSEYAQLSGVTSLKIKHNNVLGYFIEVTPKHGDVLLSGPHKDEFIHRQTLVSGIRFTTTKLVDLDAKISSAAEKALAMELEIYNRFCQRVVECGEDIRSVAAGLAVIDVLCAGAKWARDTGAVRPIVDKSTRFEISGGRHPVVEASLAKSGAPAFTANDCSLDADAKLANRLTMITGPNMAGKSTYLRQNALMFILAQSGFYVPATKAHIGIADAVFSRVGASDDLSRGRSTFMTEMIETASILNRARKSTFVILDEIGRGTATFDGLSIAWASAEHLYEVNQCRALFATHYHELTNLIDGLDGAGNACLHAKEWDGDLVFLHDVRPGAADKSYGIQVAKLAGLPELAIHRAREVLNRLESSSDKAEDKLGGLPLFNAQPVHAKPKDSIIDKAVAELDVDELSPRAALDLIYELKALSQKKDGSA